MRKITRQEMWFAIIKKYPSLDAFMINCRWKEYSHYIKRDYLFEILIEMKIHKSRHLKKAQKIRVEYELNLKTLNKL